MPLETIFDTKESAPESLREYLVPGEGPLEGKFVMDINLEGHPRLDGIVATMNKLKPKAAIAEELERMGLKPADVKKMSGELAALRKKIEAAQGDDAIPQEMKRLQREHGELMEKVADLSERATRGESAEKELRDYKRNNALREAALAGGVLPQHINKVIKLVGEEFALDETGNLMHMKGTEPSGTSVARFFKEVYKAQDPMFYEPVKASGAGTTGSTRQASGDSEKGTTPIGKIARGFAKRESGR